MAAQTVKEILLKWNIDVSDWKKAAQQVADLLESQASKNAKAQSSSLKSLQQQKSRLQEILDVLKDGTDELEKQVALQKLSSASKAIITTAQDRLKSEKAVTAELSKQATHAGTSKKHTTSAPVTGKVTDYKAITAEIQKQYTMVKLVHSAQLTMYEAVQRTLSQEKLITAEIRKQVIDLQKLTVLRTPGTTRPLYQVSPPAPPGQAARPFTQSASAVVPFGGQSPALQGAAQLGIGLQLGEEADATKLLAKRKALLEMTQKEIVQLREKEALNKGLSSEESARLTKLISLNSQLSRQVAAPKAPVAISDAELAKVQLNLKLSQGLVKTKAEELAEHIKIAAAIEKQITEMGSLDVMTKEQAAQANKLASDLSREKATITQQRLQLQPQLAQSAALEGAQKLNVSVQMGEVPDTAVLVSKKEELLALSQKEITQLREQEALNKSLTTEESTRLSKLVSLYAQLNREIGAAKRVVPGPSEAEVLKAQLNLKIAQGIVHTKEQERAEHIKIAEAIQREIAAMGSLENATKSEIAKASQLAAELSRQKAQAAHPSGGGREQQGFLGGLIEGFSSRLAGTIGFAVLSAEGLGRVIEEVSVKLKNLIAETGPLLRVQEQFQKLATSQGIDPTKFIDDMRTATKGLVGDTELYRTANLSLQSGLGSSRDDIIKLTQATVGLARAQGKDSKEAVEALDSFLVTGYARTLARVTGLQANMLQGVRSMGGGFDQTSRLTLNFQQALALITRQYQAIGEPQLTYGERLRQLAETQKRFFDELAIGIQKSAGFKLFLDDIGAATVEFNNLAERAAGWGDKLGLAFTVISESLKLLKTVIGDTLLPWRALIGALSGQDTSATSLTGRFTTLTGILGTLAQALVLARVQGQLLGDLFIFVGETAIATATLNVKKLREALTEFTSSVKADISAASGDLSKIQDVMSGKKEVDYKLKITVPPSGQTELQEIEAEKRMAKVKEELAIKTSQVQMEATQNRIKQEQELVDAQYNQGLLTIGRYLQEKARLEQADFQARMENIRTEFAAKREYALKATEMERISATFALKKAQTDFQNEQRALQSQLAEKVKDLNEGKGAVGGLKPMDSASKIEAGGQTLKSGAELFGQHVGTFGEIITGKKSEPAKREPGERKPEVGGRVPDWLEKGLSGEVGQTKFFAGLQKGFDYLFKKAGVQEQRPGVPAGAVERPTVGTTQPPPPEQAAAKPPEQEGQQLFPMTPPAGFVGPLPPSGQIMLPKEQMLDSLKQQYDAALVMLKSNLAASVQMAKAQLAEIAEQLKVITMDEAKATLDAERAQQNALRQIVMEALNDEIAAKKNVIDTEFKMAKDSIDRQRSLLENSFQQNTLSADEYLTKKVALVEEEYQATAKAEKKKLEDQKNSYAAQVQYAGAIIAAEEQKEKELTAIQLQQWQIRAKAVEDSFSLTNRLYESELTYQKALSAFQGAGTGIKAEIPALQQLVSLKEKQLQDERELLTTLAQSGKSGTEEWFKQIDAIQKTRVEILNYKKSIIDAKTSMADMSGVFSDMQAAFASLPGTRGSKIAAAFGNAQQMISQFENINRKVAMQQEGRDQSGILGRLGFGRRIEPPGGPTRADEEIAKGSLERVSAPDVTKTSTAINDALKDTEGGIKDWKTSLSGMTAALDAAIAKINSMLGAMTPPPPSGTGTPGTGLPATPGVNPQEPFSPGSLLPQMPSTPTPATTFPGLAKGGTVTGTGLALVHRGEKVVPASSEYVGVDSIPRFQEGGDVDETGPALVHKGEYVLKPDEAPLWKKIKEVSVVHRLTTQQIAKLGPILAAKHQEHRQAVPGLFGRKKETTSTLLPHIGPEPSITAPDKRKTTYVITAGEHEKVPALDIGGSVKKAGMAFVHQGEQVVPAAVTAALTNLAAVVTKLTASFTALSTAMTRTAPPAGQPGVAPLLASPTTTTGTQPPSQAGAFDFLTTPGAQPSVAPPAPAEPAAGAAPFSFLTGPASALMPQGVQSVSDIFSALQSAHTSSDTGGGSGGAGTSTAVAGLNAVGSAATSAAAALKGVASSSGSAASAADDSSKSTDKTFGKLSDSMSAGISKISQGMQGVGGLMSAISGQGGPAQAGMTGMAAGAQLGSIGGPIGMGIGAVAGLITGLFAGAALAATQKMANQLTAMFNTVIQEVQGGTQTLLGGIQNAQALITQTVSDLTGKKGGRQELQALLPQMEQQLTQLQAQQRQVLEGFRSNLEILNTPIQYQDQLNAIQQIVNQYQAYIQAGGSVADANEFLQQSFSNLAQQGVQQLNQDEQDAINNALNYNNLLLQRQNLIQDTNAQIQQIMSQGVAVQQMPEGVAKAQQIEELQRNASQQLDQMNQQISVSQYQVQAQQKIFGLATTRIGLETQLIVLQNQQTDLQTKQVEALGNVVGSLSTALPTSMPAALQELGLGAAYVAPTAGEEPTAPVKTGIQAVDLANEMAYQQALAQYEQQVNYPVGYINPAGTPAGTENLGPASSLYPGIPSTVPTTSPVPPVIGGAAGATGTLTQQQMLQLISSTKIGQPIGGAAPPYTGGTPGTGLPAPVPLGVGGTAGQLAGLTTDNQQIDTVSTASGTALLVSPASQMGSTTDTSGGLVGVGSAAARAVSAINDTYAPASRPVPVQPVPMPITPVPPGTPGTPGTPPPVTVVGPPASETSGFNLGPNPLPSSVLQEEVIVVGPGETETVGIVGTPQTIASATNPATASNYESGGPLIVSTPTPPPPPVPPGGPYHPEGGTASPTPTSPLSAEGQQIYSAYLASLPAGQAPMSPAQWLQYVQSNPNDVGFLKAVNAPSLVAAPVPGTQPVAIGTTPVNTGAGGFGGLWGGNPPTTGPLLRGGNILPRGFGAPSPMTGGNILPGGQAPPPPANQYQTQTYTDPQGNVWTWTPPVMGLQSTLMTSAGEAPAPVLSPGYWTLTSAASAPVPIVAPSPIVSAPISIVSTAPAPPPTPANQSTTQTYTDAQGNVWTWVPAHMSNPGGPGGMQTATLNELVPGYWMLTSAAAAPTPIVAPAPVSPMPIATPAPTAPTGATPPASNFGAMESNFYGAIASIPLPGQGFQNLGYIMQYQVAIKLKNLVNSVVAGTTSPGDAIVQLGQLQSAPIMSMMSNPDLTAAFAQAQTLFQAMLTTGATGSGAGIVAPTVPTPAPVTPVIIPPGVVAPAQPAPPTIPIAPIPTPSPIAPTTPLPGGGATGGTQGQYGTIVALTAPANQPIAEWMGVPENFGGGFTGQNSGGGSYINGPLNVPLPPNVQTAVNQIIASAKNSPGWTLSGSAVPAGTGTGALGGTLPSSFKFLAPSQATGLPGVSTALSPAAPSPFTLWGGNPPVTGPISAPGTTATAVPLPGGSGSTISTMVSAAQTQVNNQLSATLQRQTIETNINALATSRAQIEAQIVTMKMQEINADMQRVAAHTALLGMLTSASNSGNTLESQMNALYQSRARMGLGGFYGEVSNPL
jgi:hypothetical protein